MALRLSETVVMVPDQFDDVSDAMLERRLNGKKKKRNGINDVICLKRYEIRCERPRREE